VFFNAGYKQVFPPKP